MDEGLYNPSQSGNLLKIYYLFSDSFLFKYNWFILLCCFQDGQQSDSFTHIYLFILLYVHICTWMLNGFSRVRLFATLWTHWVPLDSPSNNAGMGCYALLQGIYPTQGSNLHLLWLLHCRWILHCKATGETLYIYMYMSIFLVRLFFIIDYSEILNIIPCVIQQSRSLFHI